MNCTSYPWKFKGARTFCFLVIMLICIGVYLDQRVEKGYTLISSMIKLSLYENNPIQDDNKFAPGHFIPEPYSTDISEYFTNKLHTKHCNESEIELGRINSFESTIAIKFAGSFECAILVLNTIVDGVRKGKLKQNEYINIGQEYKSNSIAADNPVTGKPE